MQRRLIAIRMASLALLISVSSLVGTSAQAATARETPQAGALVCGAALISTDTQPDTPSVILVAAGVAQQRRSGTGMRLRCRLIDGLPVAEWRHFKLHDIRRIEMLNGITQLKAWEADRESGTIGSGNIQLPPADGWRETVAGGTQVHYLHLQRANAARCRLTNRGQCSSSVELTTSARLRGRVLELSQKTYLNGRLSEAVIWQLPR